MAGSFLSTGGPGGSSKKGTKIQTPKAPQVSSDVVNQDLLEQTSVGVKNPYGTSKVVELPNGQRTIMNTLNPRAQRMFKEAFSRDYGDGVAANLMAKAREMIDPVMAARGLPSGSEINDTALLRAAIDASMGARQAQMADRQMAMGMADRVSGADPGNLQVAIAPWMAQVDRDNLAYQAKIGNDRAAAANRSANKSSKNSAVANLGAAGMGM